VLLKEWAVQASLETDLELPVSVIASADAALQAKGQIGFIKLFTKPLFDAVSGVLPGKLDFTRSDRRKLTLQSCSAMPTGVRPIWTFGNHDQKISLRLDQLPSSSPQSKTHRTTSDFPPFSRSPSPSVLSKRGHWSPVHGHNRISCRNRISRAVSPILP